MNSSPCTSPAAGVPHFAARPLIRLSVVGLLALLTVVSLVAPAAAQKRIYIANDDHTDYFWTGDASQYRSAFLTTLDYYMNQIESTAGNPSDQQSRYNMDCSLWLWEYERNKSATAYQRLIGHLRTGKLSMPLNPAVQCFGAMPAEAVLRGMYYAGRIERRENLRFPLVVAMENQTLPGGVASLWAGAGAQYSWRGVCGCATQTPWGNRPREIYHFNGPDGTGVCMKWNTMRGDNEGVGGYAEARDPSAAVDYLDSNSAFLAKWPWAASAAFGYGWDDLQTTTSAFVSTAQSKANASRRVIVSNEVDFFQDFLANYSSQIPTFSGSFGNEWDLYSASMGEVTADFKRHIEKLRTAEAMASVVSLFDASFMTPRVTARDQAFMSAGLYYEHDWTADGPVSRSTRAQFQRDQLTNLKNYVNPLLTDATTGIGARIAQPGATERYFVFNPLSWARGEAADLPSTKAAPLHVIDVTTGFETPSQVIGSGSTQKVRILASDIPAVGYKVFEVVSGAGQTFPAAATVAGATVDNGLYAVTLGTAGNVTSVVDHKDANRQLVESGNSLNSLGSGSGTVSVESSGPVSVTLRVVAGGSPAHETRITLYAGLDRIDVEGTITANFSGSVAYDYRFNLAGSTLRHEEVGMIAKVARAAAGGDYADQNTRTDWLSFGHFADLSTSARGVTVSNWDSPFFQAGNSTVSTLDGATPRIRACVGMQVDGTGLGIQNQGGDSRFTNRFSLRTHLAYDQAAAMRFSLEHQNPFVAARVTGTSTSTLPATSWRMIDLPSNDVLLWALKPAEEGIGQGIIARVWNLAEGTRSFTLGLPANSITSAKRTTHLETDLGTETLASGAVSGSLARQQMATYRLFPGALTNNDVIPPASITDLRGP